jgi:hypothetical protein
VHRPDHDGGVAHLGRHQRGHAGAALRLALDEALIGEPGQRRPDRGDGQPEPGRQVGVLDDLAGGEHTGDDRLADAVERHVAQQHPADGGERRGHN